MKDILNVLKGCIKENNISPQLDNIEFSKENITVYSDGNLIIVDNNTGINGYLHGKTTIKIIESFQEPKYIETSDTLLIKEGKRKTTIQKYVLSGGEEPFNIPEEEETIANINESIVNTLKLCSYSAKNSNINTSGDGIIFDFDSKFKRIYSSNGDVMSISNIFCKEKGKFFIPLFIIENIIKYYEPDSKLFISKNYVKYVNSKYKFLSMCEDTKEEIDINKILNDIKIIQKNIKITEELRNSILNVINLTDFCIDLTFVKNRIDIYGYSNMSVTEDSINVNNEVNTKIRINKDYLKYAITEFDIIEICNSNDVNFLKFKKSSNALYVSSINEDE